jgi:hypothetical protein
MPYLLLNENKTVDTLPVHPDVSKVEKRIRPKPFGECYLRWHGAELQQITIYDRAGQKTTVNIRQSIERGHTIEHLCAALHIPPAWCVADYRP